MHLRSRITLALLFLFALSVSLQGLTTATAGMNLATPESHAAMAMSTAADPMDCPSHDGLDQADCMAMCAGIIGVLFEPSRLPILQSHRTFQDERAASLSDRSIIPEPHPPRPSALI